MNSPFDYIRPDEVAECWDGVLSHPGLYQALWASMDNMPALPNMEDNGPHDVIGINSLASVWDKFSPEHQAALIELEKANG